MCTLQSGFTNDGEHEQAAKQATPFLVFELSFLHDWYFITSATYVIQKQLNLQKGAENRGAHDKLFIQAEWTDQWSLTLNSATSLWTMFNAIKVDDLAGFV